MLCVKVVNQWLIEMAKKFAILKSIERFLFGCIYNMLYRQNTFKIIGNIFEILQIFLNAGKHLKMYKYNYLNSCSYLFVF